MPKFCVIEAQGRPHIFADMRPVVNIETTFGPHAYFISSHYESLRVPASVIRYEWIRWRGYTPVRVKLRGTK